MRGTRTDEVKHGDVEKQRMSSDYLRRRYVRNDRGLLLPRTQFAKLFPPPPPPPFQDFLQARGSGTACPGSGKREREHSLDCQWLREATERPRC